MSFPFEHRKMEDKDHKISPPVSWCWTHGRTLTDCYQTGGTVLVDRECNQGAPFPFDTREEAVPQSPTTEK